MTERNKAENCNFGAEELEFAVFCIENVAAKLGITGDSVYQMLAVKSDILDQYVIANYEILHTQGKEYIVRDILDCMKE
ncbi:MAG: DUF3791 domain-containing protein, partial [Alistipes sp.]|nr:DUF3791 domain-containing protein [Alistipes sp.]